jgi:hypothetical protein
LEKIKLIALVVIGVVIVAGIFCVLLLPNLLPETQEKKSEEESELKTIKELLKEIYYSLNFSDGTSWEEKEEKLKNIYEGSEIKIKGIVNSSGVAYGWPGHHVIFWIIDQSKQVKVYGSSAPFGIEIVAYALFGELPAELEEKLGIDSFDDLEGLAITVTGKITEVEGPAYVFPLPRKTYGEVIVRIEVKIIDMSM